MLDEIDPRIPNTSTAWQLWHIDMFDRDSPPALQASGMNILQGLYELWLATLNEGILDNGSGSFSRFYLTWVNTPATRVDVAVNPFDNLGLLKLRQWANLMSQNQDTEDIQIVKRLEKGRDAIIWRVTQLHYELLQKSRRWTSSAIDWSAEARELLARLELIVDPKEL